MNCWNPLPICQIWLLLPFIHSQILKFVAGKHSGPNEEVITVVNGYSEDLQELHLRDGIQLLDKLQGQYTVIRKTSGMGSSDWRNFGDGIQLLEKLREWNPVIGETSGMQYSYWRNFRD